VVADTGKTLRPDAFKPVNLPEAVGVVENAAGEPTAVKAGRRQTVKSIEERWRIDDEWWRTEQISRMYYVAVMVGGQRMVVFKDLIKGDWWKQQ